MRSNIRSPAVAGQFYEEDPSILKGDIRSMVSDAGTVRKIPENSLVRALIMPHAGYVYSGLTAVKTALEASGAEYDKILFIAPTHRVPMKGLALCSYDAYMTPIGEIPVDVASVQNILSKNSPLIRMNDSAHTYEHSLEVELPILQETVECKEILPFICGQINAADANEIALMLKDFWTEKVLWVISSDFTHYGHSFAYVPFDRQIPENLRKLDLGAAEKILNFDLEGFSSYISRTGATICGTNPIKVLLAVMSQFSGGKDGLRSELVDYTTSGALTGDYNHCVSYAGFAFYVPEKK